MPLSSLICFSFITPLDSASFAIPFKFLKSKLSSLTSPFISPLAAAGIDSVFKIASSFTESRLATTFSPFRATFTSPPSAFIVASKFLRLFLAIITLASIFACPTSFCFIIGSSLARSSKTTFTSLLKVCEFISNIVFWLPIVAIGVITALFAFITSSFTSAVILPFAIKFDGSVRLKSLASNAPLAFISFSSTTAEPTGLPSLGEISAVSEILPFA